MQDARSTQSESTTPRPGSVAPSSRPLALAESESLATGPDPRVLVVSPHPRRPLAAPLHEPDPIDTLTQPIQPFFMSSLPPPRPLRLAQDRLAPELDEHDASSLRCATLAR